ncbi:MAG: hypothetical protein MR020_10100, partial [Lachnospiraceae bacterium]|nr:hypothetical protein [Lachnospiraceae bacterium]
MELFSEKGTVCFGVERDCESGIFMIAQKVAGDMELVSGSRPDIVFVPDELYQKEAEALVLFATVGRSEVLEQLERQGCVDLSGMREKNEVFACFLFEDAEAALEDTDFKGICRQLLLICGSDKRGTIYG